MTPPLKNGGVWRPVLADNRDHVPTVEDASPSESDDLVPRAAAIAPDLVAELHVARHARAAALLGVGAGLRVPTDPTRTHGSWSDRVMRHTARLAARFSFHR